MRISVSKLAEFDRFCRLEHYTVEDFIRRLREPVEENEAMRRGTAFHSFIESESDGAAAAGYPDLGGYTFSTAAPHLKHDLVLPDEFEVSGRFDVFARDDTVITVTGRADGLARYPGGGGLIMEYKTTRRIDPETYFGSAQWRLYLRMWPEFDAVRYDVFQLAAPRSHPKQVTITDHWHVELARYGALHAEMDDLVRRYAAALAAWEKDGLVKLGPRGVVEDGEDPFDP